MMEALSEFFEQINGDNIRQEFTNARLSAHDFGVSTVLYIL